MWILAALGFKGIDLNSAVVKEYNWTFLQGLCKVSNVDQIFRFLGDCNEQVVQLSFTSSDTLWLIWIAFITSLFEQIPKKKKKTKLTFIRKGKYTLQLDPTWKKSRIYKHHFNAAVMYSFFFIHYVVLIKFVNTLWNILVPDYFFRILQYIPKKINRI